MRIKLLTFTLLLTLVPSAYSQARKIENNFNKFSVPFAPWHFIIDGKDFVIEKQQVKPDGKYAYYLLRNKEAAMSVSLFIEPADKCKTAKECRDFILAAGNPAWENPQNLVQTEIGEASIFEFLIPVFRGQPIRQQNLYAQYVKDGFWIDLHISKTLYKESDHEKIMKIVESVKFETKPEKPFDDARKALDSWLEIWDDGKYDAAHAALSETTTKNIDKRKWFVYWSGVRKPLGKLRSREMIESEYINSLAGFPENEGLIFKVQSTFESGRSVVEIIPLIRDNDGRWRVMTYLTN